MKILVVNSNTTQFVTDVVEAEAKKTATGMAEIKAVTGHIGAAVISCRSEDAIGAYSTLELVAEHAHDCDAVLVAVSFDSGVRAARELLSIPVVGMTEAAVMTSCLVAGQFAVLTFGARAVPVYEELIATYGLSERLACVHAMPVPTNFDVRDIRKMGADILKEIDWLAKAKGAEAVYLCGAVFAGMAQEIRDASPVPVIDGVSSGIQHAQALANLELKKPRLGSYSHPARKELLGVSEALKKRYRELPE